MKEDRYFFSDYSLSWKDFFFTMTASYIGAGSFLAVTKEAMISGLFSLLTIPIPSVLSLIASYFLWDKLLLERGKTVGEIICSKKSFLKNYVDFILLWYLILLSSSQIIALLKIKEIFFSKGNIILYVLLFIVFFYTLKYGFKGVVLTDKVQFLLLLPAIFVFFFSINWEKKIIFTWSFKFEYILIMLSFTIAWTISPITIQRIMAVKNKNECGKGVLSSSVILFTLYVFIVISQIYHENYITDFAVNLSDFYKIVFVVSVISAILSTVDTIINTSSHIINRSFKLSVHMGVGITFLISILIAYYSRSILKTLGLSSEIIIFSFSLPFIMKMLKIKATINEISWIIIVGSLFSFLSFFLSFTRFDYISWPYSVLFYLIFTVIYILFKLRKDLF